MNLREAVAWYAAHKDNFYCASVGPPSASQGQWIQNAIKNPGALRAKAVTAGAMTQKDTINVGWLRKMAAQRTDMETARQARLALTLRKLRQ